MDINVTGRNATITDRFREYTTDKVAKVEQLLPKAQNLTVKLTKHATAHDAQSAGARVEITVRGPGGVIRAEAEGPDKYRAFDQAYHRVMERSRRLHDKRISQRRGPRAESLRDASAAGFADKGIQPANPDVIDAVANGEVTAAEQGLAEEELEWSPVVIREKRFDAVEMTPREAIDQMELIGHPFYLFINSGTGEANVVYRRKGWSYGVISLDTAQEQRAAG
ncbi:MAG TPA: ribosome-associated translation inhibitor RaiA [Candidatus Agrococcus pullicola]|uniref:Ribosome hibernation promoting factor n=1 Tax=Candidatus Agrococcus pullicola TaxID=2838429 RepID=A0A9D1YVG2_9MICO|nr:ribosome-associated translation inhibitor RaiA [Candidatus Agrococcus pullicola]